MFRPNEKSFFFTVATPGDWVVVFDFPFKYPPTLNLYLTISSCHDLVILSLCRNTLEERQHPEISDTATSLSAT